jgi:anti-sigma factor ChrR (cupin superfamily)
MNRYAKRGLLESGPSPKDQAAAASRSARKVPHASDTAKAETDETAAIRDYWQAAKARYQRGDYVDYGSDDWKALPVEDPRKMAGLVAFAQLWLRYGDEIAADLNRQLRAPEPLWQRPTLAELNQAHADMLARARRSNRKEAA